MPTFTSNDAQINYQTFGDATKPALVFSNSLGTKFSMWQPQIEFFQKDYFVVCYDTRGHGGSTAPQGPYQLDQLGQDVIHLLDHLNIQKAAFCGISMGGLTGQWLAINHPERFNHVIVANTAAKIGQEQAWLERAALVRAQGLAPIASTAASRWFTEPFIQSNAAIVAELSNDLGAGSPEGYASCCEALAKADLREQIKSVLVPVLIVAGQQDPVTTVADAQAMQHSIVNSQLCEINASHISSVEQAEAFNQAVQAFLAA
ncbi:3-oxoadipate enol-lactonase [Acinetobacter bohemicus]|uniref:3-oxoadipate enol-lactonase n=1 Tax=Acinetobacter TaxID=469 RepID=UPI00157BD442|nr:MULTISPECIES: 3-oxoadipate enol-lactonase [Acinetobacter]MCO8043389.1 3-oxoadipate enol-lactonase [Acinetobacter sp. S4400-12]MCU7225058.1 3-oxoadipate enol-lactonase [Acinetobacter bohemicus]MDM1780332.1 3-oxoadipate enol-lactonase [Acinetobacter indicus]QKQ70060.1 3-oxoadipate enol-lactonase [Acinetobacter sp. 10FS3-1]